MTLEPVTRLRSTQAGTDAYGNPIFTEASTALAPARFAPAGAAEPAQAGSVVVTSSPSLYWRGTWPDVTVADRLTVRGVTYEVDGPPADWRGSGVTPGGMVVKLRSAG